MFLKIKYSRNLFINYNKNKHGISKNLMINNIKKIEIKLIQRILDKEKK